MKNELRMAGMAAMVSVSVLGASDTAGRPATGSPSMAAASCEPNLDAPTAPAPPTPTGIRIIRPDQMDGVSWQADIETMSGPWAPPDAPTAGAAYGPHDYFDLLTTRPDCLTSFHFRSQANIDLTPSRADGPRKIPIRYDPAADAARFEIDPSGSVPHSGSTGTPQKRLPISIQGTTSMLLTFDFKIDASMRWKPQTESRVVDGKTVTLTFLEQHKSHRLDDHDAEPWIGMKQSYLKGGNQGQGIALFFFNARKKFMGPGTQQGGSETITPVTGEFFVEPDTWTRVWVFVEGNIGTGDNAVRLSAWLADENRAPMRLYNRVNMITPPDGIGLFRFEFDSSQKSALNGPGQQYQRNWVVLKGPTEAQVLSLLQKPL